MLVTMAGGILIISVTTEMLIIAKIPWLRKQLEKRALVSLAFSMWLSWFIGMIFGAAGMIIMFAALGSSIVSWFIYRVLMVSELAISKVRAITVHA